MGVTSGNIVDAARRGARTYTQRVSSGESMDNQVTPAEYADGVVAFQFDGDIELAFNYLVDKHSQAMHLSYCYCQLRNREKEQVWLRKARRYEEAAEHCLELL